MREIINQQQFDILSAIAQAPDSTRKDVLKNSVLKTIRDHDINDLREREMVSVIKDQNTHLFNITRKGTQTMHDHMENKRISEADKEARKTRTNNMKTSNYVPSYAYCRNDGHVGILSRGMW